MEDFRSAAHTQLDLLLDYYEQFGTPRQDNDPVGKTEAAICVHSIIEDLLEGPASWALAHTRGLACQCIEAHSEQADAHTYEDIGRVQLTNEDKVEIESNEILADVYRLGLVDLIRRHPSLFQPQSASWLGRSILSLNQGEARGPLIPKDVGKRKHQARKEEFGMLYVLLIHYLAGKSGKHRNTGAMAEGRSAAKNYVSIHDRKVDDWQSMVPEDQRRIAFTADRVETGKEQSSNETVKFLAEFGEFLEADPNLWRAFYHKTSGS